MNPPSRRFEVVDDPVEAPPQAAPAPAKQPLVNRVSVEMLSMAISALSQRALTALAACFSLLTVASAFWLWYLTPVPTDRQIISLALYALFVLAINVIVRRR
jgi:hypothetical protein